jgi:DNA-binding NtrC family response regulator
VEDRAHILVVEDDEAVRAHIAAVLRDAGLNVHSAGSGEEALALLEAFAPDASLLDLELPGIDGRAVLRALRTRFPHAPAIMLTGHREAELAVECMKAGAWDYLVKPVEDVRLLATVSNAVHQHALERSMHAFRRAAGGELPAGLLGESPAFLGLLADVARAAEGDQPVLVLGEPGTERAAVARALHLGSRRAAGPFAALRCGGLSAAEQANELFGNDGASGRISAAAGGSFHLEDVEALAAPVQERLAAALALASRARLGAVTAPDFRLVASSAVDLGDVVRRQALRADLYLRLTSSELAIPPLRARGEDVLLLARHDLAARAGALGRPPPTLAPDALEALRAHPWPGNRDELRRAVEDALERVDGRVLRRADLALGPASTPPPTARPNDSLRLIDLEREAILAALERVAGNRSGASRELGISRATLYRKLREHGIK